ncbi:hypothetical protein LOZ66_003044 [Ophidiomyces ophidiicola]|nr:hypothetical protein LOZ66_003044 [Ophidiomyces ophidiicola]
MGQAGSSQRADFLRRSPASEEHRRSTLSLGSTMMRSDRAAGGRDAVVENSSRSTSDISDSSVLTPRPVSLETPTSAVDTQDINMGGLTPQSSTDPRPSSHRQSTMSRLGSRIFPSSLRRNLQDRPESREGRGDRTPFFSRSSGQDSRGSAQSSALRGLGPRGITRRRSIRGPYALPRGESALLPESPPNPTFLDTDRSSDSRRFSWRRQSRLNLMRDSMAAPISQIFGQLSTSASTQTSTTPPRRPSRSEFTEDSDNTPLRPQNVEAMDLDEPHELDSVEPAARHVRSNSSPSARYIPSISDPRRSPGTIRSRATRLLRRDEATQTPLSHILHLAASALAAQISGNTSPSAPNIQSVGSEGLDGPLESLLQGLQQIASSQEGSSNGDDLTEGGLPNVNFLRVFRFVNPDNSQDGSIQSTVSHQAQDGSGDPEEANSATTTDDNAERRLLTLVVVGVRSIPTNPDPATETGNNGRLNVESLLRLPFLSPGNMLRPERGPSNFLRRGDSRPRFYSNRNSIAEHPIPAAPDSSRTQRMSTPSRRQSDVGSLADFSSSLPTVLSESPPGPNPPPSTPADPGLSGASSVVNTPSRRPSSASAFLPQLNEDSSGEAEATAQQNSGFNFPRQRRRSDSEAARHRGLGSGSARRNGVVEPDDPSPSTTRSWLIYVVGANLAENHPALAAPSLFSDNPTYEDMMLLSSLLGPVKPPVASEEEVASAGGLYQVVRYPESLVAEPADESERILIGGNDRCLICLCGYEAEEHVRLLANCKHMYHRECIDEALAHHRPKLVPIMSRRRRLKL